VRTLSAFTLLELVISIAIAAILSLSLTMLLNQSYASQKKLENLTQLHERATLLFTQLERDLMGATIPIENILSSSAPKGASDSAKATSDKTADRAKKEGNIEKSESKTSSDAEKKADVPYKPFDRVFYYKRGNNQLFFSWITDNPLQLYWGAAVGAARPRIARVMYRLEQDPNDKTLFKLMRAEGFDLTYTPYEKHTEQKYKGYALVEGIKSLKITLVSVVVKKEDESSSAKASDSAKATSDKTADRQKKEQKPPQTEVKTADTWEWPLPKDDSKKADDKKEQELPPLPQGIRIELVLWNEATEREVTFDYGIYIPSLPVLQRSSSAPSGATADKDKKDLDGAPKPGAPGTPQPTNPTAPGGPQGGRNPITGFGGGLQPRFNQPAPQFNVLNLGNGQQMIRRMS
jgi:type II secretory pathway component PulJ